MGWHLLIRIILSIFLLLIISFQFGCAQDYSEKVADIKEEEILITGYIHAFDRQRDWFGTGVDATRVLIVDPNRANYLSDNRPYAAWMTYIDSPTMSSVLEETMIIDEENNKRTFNELRIGQKVNVWHQGTKTERYPLTPSARLIQLTSQVDNYPISEAEAIKAVLSSPLFDERDIYFIKEVVLDENRQKWAITINRIYSPLENNKIVHVDIKSGELLDVIIEK